MPEDAGEFGQRVIALVAIGEPGRKIIISASEAGLRSS